MHFSPFLMTVRIEQSKTYPSCQSMDIYLGKALLLMPNLTHSQIHLSEKPGCLFIFSDSSTLSCQQLVDADGNCLWLAGLDDVLYAGHSFYFGKSSTAMKNGVENHLILTLGR